MTSLDSVPQGVTSENVARRKDLEVLLAKYPHFGEVFDFKLTQRNGQAIAEMSSGSRWRFRQNNIFSPREILKADYQETYQRFGHGGGRDY